uniref:Secreted protein n=1 Tax=Ixodes ricinus TaxID=34613 RepID=A0A6B0V3S6_IXORI
MGHARGSVARRLLLALWGPGAPATVALAHPLLGAGHPEVVVALVVHPGSEVVPAHPELTVLQRLQLVAVQVGPNAAPATEPVAEALLLGADAVLVRLALAQAATAQGGRFLPVLGTALAHVLFVAVVRRFVLKLRWGILWMVPGVGMVLGQRWRLPRLRVAAKVPDVVGLSSNPEDQEEGDDAIQGPPYRHVLLSVLANSHNHGGEREKEEHGKTLG